MRGLTNRLKLGMITVLGFIMAVCILIAFTTQTTSASENLLGNSGLEEISSDIPTLWSTVVYEEGKTNFTIGQEGPHSGSSYITIESLQANDARWVQKIKVKANTIYKLSGWAKTDNVGTNAKGANISIEGIADSSVDIKGTSDWQPLEMYLKTDKKQEELAFLARLGGYGSANTGKASFDDLAVEEIAAAPEGANVVQLGAAVKQAEASSAPKGDGVIISYTRMIWWTLIFIGLFIFVNRLMIRRQFLVYSLSEAKVVMAILICVAAFFRLLVAPSMVGFASDVYSFMSWSQDVSTNGMAHFYGRPDFLADYPPGYMIVLYILGKISHAFGMNYKSDASLILYKMPAMIADLVTTYLIYRIAKKMLPTTAAIGLAALYAFNPAIILNSAAWGQVDSFFTMFVLIAVIMLVRGKVPLSTALFAVAVLLKPQALMFGPLLLFVFIRIRKDYKTILISVVTGLLVLIIVPLPFTIHQHNGPLYLIDLYTSTLGSYNYASLNAYNVITLVGGNWQPITDKILFLSYTHWSYLLILASLIYCGVLYFKSKADDTKLYWIAFFFMTAVFMVTVKMHERYLFYALVFALMSFIHFKDRRILYLFFGLSLTHFFNTDEILGYSLTNNFKLNRYGMILIYTSLANTLMFIYMIKVGWDVLVKDKITPTAADKLLPLDSKKTGEPAMRLTREAEPEIKLNKLDYRLIAGLTLVYLVFALINLGSFKAPETFWQPANAGESFYISLDSEQAIKKINTFGGPGDGNFDVDFSSDLKTWRDARLINRDGGVVFAWTSMDIDIKAKYARVTAKQPGFRLNEIALYGEDSSKPLHVEIVVPGTKSSLSKGKPSYVFDEPDQAAYKPSFMNGTYFDEIYHARTAYEQLHKIEPYESTHPPLGKIIIGLGTAIFGTNPFGWRIMGTLFGVGMIPIFYAFGKMLFRRTEYAFMGAFLLAFDFMHFVQTRISTIDVYGVFFIILMYYYMYKYYRLSFYNTSLRQTLTPLALSGLFFGLGAASKWIAIYAGAGLAVILFLVLYERYREFAFAQKSLVTKHVVKKEDNTQSYYRHVIQAFKPSLIKTLAWCMLFFVGIPAVIYVLSFIPFMLVPGPGHGLHEVITYQKHMYEYHKNLVATHPFSSVWYQWPIMQKPLWYYGGQAPAGKASLIVALGNPAIWWVGIVAIFSTLWIGFKKRDKTVLFLFIAMCANYVPWMLVARLTFIYHFFAMLPFMIFCIVYVIRHFKESNPRSNLNPVIYSYYAVVFLLFLMFYPILSGATVSRSYIDHTLKWISSWVF
ncbi:phospholipid carrier-dependent glycosyltransferase [Paenibacillus psychroresistens]|uniref:Phospholipid carrier-dependent glycosyltransferase n=1 Tax=Paenibacillus psychroresistens TaxID=1778678 RepID=A0A6B8RHH2_9BACL|nr:glycosyltransferase family 39 protein [Paenibacillus psychroresistens]QGQ95357.1 phospholipid carrier-dependent glycosyltransferase [Paenibacillus psychroresistens]